MKRSTKTFHARMMKRTLLIRLLSKVNIKPKRDNRRKGISLTTALFKNEQKRETFKGFELS